MSSNITNLLKGIIISIVSTLILLFIFSVILTYTSVSEKFITPTIIVITAISVFIGSTIGNFKVKKNGLINGAIIGGVYLASIYLLSSIINNNFAFTMQSVVMIIAGVLCGMFGGIIGVNRSSK